MLNFNAIGAENLEITLYLVNFNETRKILKTTKFAELLPFLSIN